MNKHSFQLCPICNQHKFPDSGDEFNCCPHCGWVHDAISEDNPLESVGPNSLSMENHKLRYLLYVEKDSSYHFKRDGYPEIPQVEPTICPVCHKFKFSPLTWDDIYCGLTPADSYCTICGWHYDENQQDNANLKDGANSVSLNEYRDIYKSKIAENPNYNYFDEMTDNS